jgi:PadR family transcriptional regulator
MRAITHNIAATIEHRRMEKRLAKTVRKRKTNRRCPRHDYPCTCAMGHLYRFVEPVLLLVLKEKGRSYGYDLLGNVAKHAFTDGEIEKAVLYRTLRRLEETGHIKSDWDTDGPGPARRVYTLTREGETHLQEWAQVLAKVAGSMARFVRKASSPSL